MTDHSDIEPFGTPMISMEPNDYACSDKAGELGAIPSPATNSKEEMSSIREFNQYPDHVFTIIAERKDLTVEFTLYEGSDWNWEVGLEPWATGYIKWDGCSNWNIPEHQVHFCGSSKQFFYCNLFRFMYKWASELMPENKKYLVEWNCDSVN